MFCIFCGHTETDVIETRLAEDGGTIRRRRECRSCRKRFTTYERMEDLPFLVIKRDGRRERFDREKLRRGILKASEKTMITADQVEMIVTSIENSIRESDGTEIESAMIGKIVARDLKKLDKIAYIRFASVFRRFVDLEDFEKELKKLQSFA